MNKVKSIREWYNNDEDIGEPSKNKWKKILYGVRRYNAVTKNTWMKSITANSEVDEWIWFKVKNLAGFVKYESA